MVVGVVGEARAQGGALPPSGSFDGVVAVFALADASIGIVGLVTGVGSSMAVSRERVSNHWCVGSLITGTINLAVGGVALFGAFELAYGGRQLLNPFFAGIAAAHFAVGLWNMVMPAIGWKTGLRPRSPADESTVAPVFVTGRLNGNRWSGVALQFSGL